MSIFDLTEELQQAITAASREECARMLEKLARDMRDGKGKLVKFETDHDVLRVGFHHFSDPWEDVSITFGRVPF